jgi:hypothetical protein
MKQIKSKNYKSHLAIAYCRTCGDIIISIRGGSFVKCECGESYLDQERFSALYVRTGGEAEFIEQICPSTCKIKEHRK